MQVVLPMPPSPPPSVAVDFNFDSTSSSPYITAPSSPQRFNNFFFSAPASPTRVTSSFFHVDSPPLPSPNHNDNHRDFDFEFNFSGHLDQHFLSAADELFHGGKIRPLKPPPPRLHSTDGDIKISDPVAAATEETPREEEEEEEELGEEKRGRGRENVSCSGRKGSRSLSPLRISDIVCGSEEKSVSSSTSNNSKPLFFSSIKGYRKWRLRDFLLFRSASEGRAIDKKDPLRKYVALSSKKEEDVRNCSFRSTESSGSVSRRRGPVSAHELHYTLNRAASEEMKKKTFLPYKQGLLGCLGFNPTATGMHHISKGIGSLTRS